MTEGLRKKKSEEVARLMLGNIQELVLMAIEKGEIEKQTAEDVKKITESVSNKIFNPQDNDV